MPGAEDEAIFQADVSRLPRLQCVTGGVTNTLSKQLLSVTVTVTERTDNRGKHEEVRGALQSCHLYDCCTMLANVWLKARGVVIRIVWNLIEASVGQRWPWLMHPNVFAFTFSNSLLGCSSVACVRNSRVITTMVMLNHAWNITYSDNLTYPWV